MSLFEELYAKFKEQQKRKDQHKSVPNVTCTQEENTMHKELEPPSVTHAQVTTRTLLNTDPKPGDCEKCPAHGFWDGHGPDPFCFYEATFLGKSAKAQLAKTRQNNCPLSKGD
jgi:hypothetical protein